MNGDYSTDEGIVDYDIEDERIKSYLLLKCGQALRRLIESIYCEYGFLLNDESRKIYEDLREYILSVDESMDEECKAQYSLFLGVQVEMDFPEKLEDIDRGNNELGHKAGDLLKYLSMEEDDLLDFTGNVIYEIFEDLEELLTQVEKVIAKNNDARDAYVSSMKRNIDESILNASINTIEKEINFAYVENPQLRALLREYFEEGVKAFYHSLFRMTVIFSRSIMEALLVYALEIIEADAMINYAEKYKTRSDSPQWRYRIKDISRWDWSDLVEIASRNGIIKYKNLDKYLHNINQYRNTIHIYKNLVFQLRIDHREANHSLLFVSWLNDDLKTWCEGSKVKEKEHPNTSI